MRPSGVPVCLMPVQQHAFGGPARVIGMLGFGSRPTDLIPYRQCEMEWELSEPVFLKMSNLAR